jgi:hypothetical protein
VRIFKALGRFGAKALLACGIAAILAASPASAWAAPWLRAETPRFVIYSNGSETTLRKYAERVELLDAVFWAVYGLERPAPPPRKLPIYLVEDIKQMRMVSPGLPDNVAGFYAADPLDVYAMGLSSAGNEYVLLHEYTHHLMLQYFPYGYPAWFVEGYAEYFMNSTVDESAIKVGLVTGRLDNLIGNNWLPFEDMLSKRVFEIPQPRRSTFYAQAWLMTHYLVSDPERGEQLKAYLTAVGQGQPSVDAMQKATGLTPDAWKGRMRTYVSGQLRYTQLKRADFPKAPVEITRPPPSTEDLLLDDMHVKTGVSPQYREGLLAQIRAKAARYPDDAFAQFALARAEVEIGDPQAGAAILKRRLAANPKDVEALALEAKRLMAEGDATPAVRGERYNQAGALLATAFKLDPARYQTLFQFAASRAGEANYPSDNTLTALLMALKLAPQVGEIRMETAQGLIKRSRTKEAAAVLVPLANSPHGGALAKQAQDLLATINPTGSAAGALSAVAAQAAATKP